MAQVEIELSCCLCPEKYTTTLDLPVGWLDRYDSISSEVGFCPKHSKIYEFAENNCPGCVGGWHDCSLWSSFAYSNFELTDSDFAIIKQGKCPKRTNGTTFFSQAEGMRSVDISSPASSESGEEFAKALHEWHERYHLRKGN